MREKKSSKVANTVYGMNGVGKQTNSILYSIKRCVMVDGKGIGRRVN